jgi:hypothetical protein
MRKVSSGVRSLEHELAVIQQFWYFRSVEHELTVRMVTSSIRTGVEHEFPGRMVTGTKRIGV